MTTTTVYTDSLYTVKCGTVWGPRWAADNFMRRTPRGDRVRVRNLALVQELLRCMSRPGVRLVHVPGHGREPADRASIQHALWAGNAGAHDLAQAGMRGAIVHEGNRRGPVSRLNARPPTI